MLTATAPSIMVTLTVGLVDCTAVHPLPALIPSLVGEAFPGWVRKEGTLDSRV